MTTDVTSQSCMKSWRRQVAEQLVYTASVFFLCLEGKHSLVSLVLKLMSQGSTIDWVG